MRKINYLADRLLARLTVNSTARAQSGFVRCVPYNGFCFRCWTADGEEVIHCPGPPE